MKKLLLLSFFSLCCLSAFSQGSISGTITDAKTKEAIIGANVVIQGTTTGAQTDVDGKFLISNVKAGTYNLQITYVTYKAHMIPDVLVEDGKRITIDVPMTEEVSMLSEVVVNGSRQTNTDYDMVKSIKEAKVIVVGITEEQINKSLDRDAAQVLKRVPGITVKDDQFIISRGLPERYNPVMLHNTYAPSVETDVRSFSFAAIPSSQLDRILVYKSPAADLPGDFAGSVVKVFTKSIPDENGIVIDYSTQYRAGTTMQDFYHQQRNPGFFTGYNTGYYNLPGGFPGDLAKLSDNQKDVSGQQIKNLWKAEKGTAIPDQRLTLTFNKKFNIGTIQVGNINALSYSNAFATFAMERGDYTQKDPNFKYNDKQYNQRISTGLLSNWAFKINSNHLIEFKNLFNTSSNDQYVRRSGVVGSISDGEANGSFDKVYRGIYSGQLMGKHDLFQKKTTVEWVTGYNNSYRDQPDYKRYISKGGMIYVPNAVTPTQLGKFYASLNEASYSGGVSLKQIIPVTNNPLRSPELKAGLYFENKTRSFHARNIGFTAAPQFNSSLASQPIDQLMQPQNINSTTGLQIDEATKRRDSYTAQNNLLAYYIMASVPMGSKFKLDAGVRFEDNLQQLHSYDEAIPDSVNVHNWIKSVLPSANLSYNFTEKMLVRAAYGQTLNRPEFREFAPFQFYDFNYNFLYNGNKSLSIAKVQNMDVRWEFYPTKGEMITIGGFYKDFTNPIESYVDINSPGGGNKLVTYENSKSAQVYGIELEVKKSLAGYTSSKLLNNLNVMVNTSVISSTVKVPEGALQVQRSSTHQMQGQAPYIVNAGLYYNSEESGWQFNLLYNTQGKTVYFVGNDNYRDVYILPRNVVDLTFTKRLSNKISLKGGIVDILNQPIRFYNSSTLGGKQDQVIQRYKPGQVVSIGFSARL